MEDLKPIYKKRDKRYTKENRKLLELIDTTLKCVTAYLTKINPAILQGIISWEDTSLMDDMVIVMGMLSYEVGKTIDIGGTKIVVTEDNVNELQHMVHMAVPIDLVEEANSEKITEYLQNLDADYDVEADTTIIELPASAPEQEFDLSELSEEQLENLRLSPIKSGN